MSEEEENIIYHICYNEIENILIHILWATIDLKDLINLLLQRQQIEQQTPDMLNAVERRKRRLIL